MIAQIGRICIIALASIWCLTIASGSFLSVNAQQPDSRRLPILLIHGYNEYPSIWDSWRGWLRADNFSNVYSITFQDDKCGSVEAHAAELNNTVNGILRNTGGEKVNIVAHSKGGLDARWYLAHSGIDKVANLIMIGTPNSGSPAAVWDISGCPFGSDSDLFAGSAATQVVDRPQSTHYYTIAGNWMPDNVCWIGLFEYPNGGNCFIPGPDDLLVPLVSAESSPHYHYTLLGVYPYSHVELLQHKDVYERAFPILNGLNS
jgi:pimeloyl-ACP methyl ester carboxylesterase